MSTLITSPFSNFNPPYAPQPTNTYGTNLVRSGSQRTTRGLSHKLRQLWRNILRPFALSHNSYPPPSDPSYSDSYAVNGSVPIRARSDTVTGQLSSLHEKTASEHTLHIVAPHHIPDPRSTKSTFLGNILRSDAAHQAADGKEYLGLPFRLSVYTAQSKVERNVPYLRHSWNRIDFIAIVAFWICFILATSGMERRPDRHIAVFRALSVLRTSRLLAVTSGTSVRSSTCACIGNDVIDKYFRRSCNH